MMRVKLNADEIAEGLARGKWTPTVGKINFLDIQEYFTRIKMMQVMLQMMGGGYQHLAVGSHLLMKISYYGKS